MRKAIGTHQIQHRFTWKYFLHIVLPPQVIERLVEIRTYGRYLQCAECQIEDQAWAGGEGTVDQVASCSGQGEGYLYKEKVLEVSVDEGQKRIDRQKRRTESGE